MKKVTKMQEVKLFVDCDDKTVQEVFISADNVSEIWITLSHNGYEMSLSLTNWDNLASLVQKTLFKFIGR